MLAPDEQLIPSLVSHPRFGFGPYPWSHFYGPKLVLDTLSLAEVHKLSGIIRAASTISRLVNSPEVSAAPRLPSPPSCDLVLHLEVLLSQGVAVRVLHHLNGGVWPDNEVLKQPGLFRAGAALHF